jgi:hypothetical protein
VVDFSHPSVKNRSQRIEMICHAGKEKQVLPSQTITGMKLHHIAAKITSLITAILLLLSHSKYVQKRTPIVSLTGVVSAIQKIENHFTKI